MADAREQPPGTGSSAAPRSDAPAAPQLALPKGGGSIRGIGEKFAANPVTGTGAMSVPIATTPGRAGFSPQLSLSYDSGAGNGPFGFGWRLSLPSITRKTDKGLPRYADADESDVFVLSGAEDLVPVFRQTPAGAWLRDPAGDFVIHEDDSDGYRVRRYRPRIEGLFAHIERWTLIADPREVHWRSLSKDNVLTLYGRTAESRLTDPGDPARIFSWLICETRDDKGHGLLYRYKAEDGAGANLREANERNRGARDDIRRTANRYLKRIHYGNHTPLLDNAGRRPRFLDHAQIDADIAAARWMFEVVFDYGEHDADPPTPAEAHEWAYRTDPFSTYRSGFEVRTTRLCRRVLMFHHFEDEPGVGRDCLVRSTDFVFSHTENPADARNPVYTFLSEVSQTGYRRNAAGYDQRSLPPVEFQYSQPVVQDVVREVDAVALENLPIGLDGGIYQWTDLHGEGIPGILSEQAGAWYYKRNLSPLAGGPVAFAPNEQVVTKPISALRDGAQLMDLAGDGQPDVVILAGPTPGLYEHDTAEGWQPFRPFSSRLNYDVRDPNLRFVDLDGDGHADVLITEDDALAWHEALGEAGFGPARRVIGARDEEKGPSVVFADGTQSIYLADLSGDGLADIVRVRNGEVCYWPNLGYGRFGSKISTDRAPLFDNPDQFDYRRLRLADIDGSGTTDIIYLHRDGVRVYFNQSGNGWSTPVTLAVFPGVDDIVSIVPMDLLGNGTACLVWSSPLPSDASRQMRYVDLMGGQKPHLLIRTINNLGTESLVQYATSTKFYLQDKREGRPWITRLPVPVHVVERVESIDHVSRGRLVTSYSYHHGYFDGDEREFRGFGMVEQRDAEAFEDYVIGVKRIEGTQELAPELNQAPVITRTWYHTGAYLDAARITHQFHQEYYRQEAHMREPAFPAGLDARERRESVRALKGLPLRQEIYSPDGSAAEGHPYSISENGFAVRLVQPAGRQRHAVFFPVGTESVAMDYERDPADPRRTHSIAIELDEYGNTLKSCSVVYPRIAADAAIPLDIRQEQQKLHITYAETAYTKDLEDGQPPHTYRMRIPYDASSHEITGITPDAGLFGIDEVAGKIAAAAPIDYEVVADRVNPERRLLARRRTLFLDNALNPLPLGEWGSLGFAHESYSLAFTSSVVTSAYGAHVSDADFTGAGYVHFNNDAHWWIPSGTAIFPANPAAHFYLAIGSRDPLGIETVGTLDKYDLLIEKVQVNQAAWNVIAAVNDYRVLAPVLITDLNNNRTAVDVDELGMVVASALMGKAGAGQGDTVADPTMRMEYELFNWKDHRKPNRVHSFAREQHGAANPRWQESYGYSNGSGDVAMVKAQAHPGKALRVNAAGVAEEVDADPRWVGNGRTILNNKGRPVKQYEPYFSTTHEYEDEKVLREIGATPILFYDSIGRNVRTLFPNGTVSRVELGPWSQRTFDANDTVKQSQWYVDRGSPDPAADPEPLNDPERRAAWLAAKHAGTPGAVHFDSLGRPVYAVSDYGAGKLAATRSETDLTGRYSRMFDELGREVGSGFTGMAGTSITGENAEKGRRWTLVNVFGALVKTWDEHGRRFRVEYDLLHRPVSSYVEEPGQPEVLFHYVVYGDLAPNAQDRNLLGVPHLVFDQGGLLRVPELDFNGNAIRVDRVLARDYKKSVDWTALAAQPTYAAIIAAADPALEIGEVFSASSQYDALNRPTRVTLPDATVIVPTYNEANFLVSLQAQVRGQGAFVPFLKGQDFDAKRQRIFVRYGNDLVATYFYDPISFRLDRLVACRAGDDPDTEALQDFRYTYDPVGNITEIGDRAQQTHYFANAVVRAETRYEYDALYQVIRATGREHAGLGNDAIRAHTDLDFVPQLPHANNAGAVRTYTEEYEYDLTGNIKVLRHRFPPQAGAGNGWTRHYRYLVDDAAGSRTNRLASSSVPGDLHAGPYTATYSYDAYGNMTRMPHLAAIDWNFMDQLRRVDLGGGGTAYYVYDSSGQRIRKVVERPGNARAERIFLGAVDIYREGPIGAAPVLERYALHIADEGERIADVDTTTIDVHNVDGNPLNTPLIRYQRGNHLGSATLETDTNGAVVSYEEYHPYGTSAYRSAKPGYKLSLKRYRFSGKELDEETGLYAFGARYYAAWLGRWTSADPAGVTDGPNQYRYCHGNPVIVRDLQGFEGTRIYQIGKEFEKDIHTNTPEAKARIEAAMTNAVVNENGTLYLIERPALEWRGDKVGWFFNTKASVISRVDAEITVEGNGSPDAPVTSDTSPPSEAPPAPDTPPNQSPATPSDSSQSSGDGGGSGSGGEKKERSFFTSSFFKGLVIGVAVTLVVVAVVATGGAALAVIAPAASAAIAGSGVGTALAVAGGAVAVASTVQSVRQRDLWNNPISEDQANFNLGVGIGSVLGGAAARPIAGAGSSLGNSLGNGANSALSTLGSGGGTLALAGGGTFAGEIAAPVVAGVTTTGVVTQAGTAAGSSVLMMAGHKADWELRDPNGQISTRGKSASGSDTPPGRTLTWDEQLLVHTERKILAQLGGKVKPGQTISIRGTKPPCDPGGRGCNSAMKAFAEKYGVKIVYRNTTTGQTWTYP